MANVTISTAAVTSLVHDPRGPVYRDFQRRVLRVDAAAKRNAPVRTGRLRASIRWVIELIPNGLRGIIGSDVEYALVQEQGSAGGQIIRPVNKRALFWEGARHPVAFVTRGTIPAKHYLLNALPAAGDNNRAA